MGRIKPWINVVLRRGTTEDYVFNLNFNASRYEEFEDRYRSAGFAFSWRHPKDLASFSTNVYGSYGRRQEKGYLIVGDPNAQEFQRRALLKLVTPLW